MNQERWELIEDLLQRALDLDPLKRGAFLERECKGDDALRREIEVMLSHEVEAQDFMESPAVVCVQDNSLGQPFVPPERISHYKIESRIGAGGMGEVYKALDEKLQRVVAIKMLPPEFTSDVERVQRFEQEAFAVSRLNHPNIVTIFEITEVDGHHFIVEEFVEGKTLRQLLTDPQTKETRKLPFEQALEIAIQIASSLKAAHTAWIIHRDIKPENIMLRDDGLVKLLDFGIAKLIDTEDAPINDTTSLDSSIGNSLTVPGAIMGTASYMSPEQARSEHLDGRADIFSLGILLHEMVSGERLFTGTTRMAVLQASNQVDEMVSRSLKLNDMPAGLQPIVRKMLRRNRDERYASASDLFQDLTRLKRQLESRTARRIVGLSVLVVLLAIALVGVAALLSINDVWDEKILSDGHTAAVRRAVFSPDGRLLISVGEDKQIIVWDFARRERIRTLSDHSSVVNAISFSPNGKWFATASDDQSVIIWDALRFERFHVIHEHNAPVRSVSFSPDGSLLVASSYLEGSAGRTLIWSTANWQQVHNLPFGQPYGTHLFLNDNRWIVDNYGQMWELPTETSKRTPPEFHGNWFAASPDGRRWVSVDGFGAMKVIDAQRMKLISGQHVHHDHARSVAFSPDNRLLATAAERVILWDAATLTKVAPLEYDSIVWSVTFSPDSRWLVSTHGDGAVLIWDVAQRELSANLKQHSGAVRAVAFSLDGKRLASASDDHDVIVWNADGGYKEAMLVGHQTRVTSVSFSANGQSLVSGDQNGVVIQWGLERRVEVRRINPLIRQATQCVALSTDGRYVALTNDIYDLETGQQVILSGTAWSRVYSATFTNQGRLVGATDDGEIIVVDAKNWQLIERRKFSDSPLVSLSLSPDGHLVTGEDGKAVRLGTYEPIRQLAVIGHHDARVKSVTFSPDGRWIASAGDDKSIKLWDVQSRKTISTIGTHSSPIYSIAFSPDGHRLVSGEHDRTVRVYTRHRQLWGYRLH